MRGPGGFLWVYGMPLLLGLLGCVGLAAALFADGAWDWVSWVALGGMTGVAVGYAVWGGR